MVPMIAMLAEVEVPEPDWKARALATEENLARIREIVAG